jgi:hypothetical protein
MAGGGTDEADYFEARFPSTPAATSSGPSSGIPSPRRDEELPMSVTDCRTHQPSRVCGCVGEAKPGRLREVV